ncbi:MAG: hypothetical protein K6G69_01245 [Lachnospiraceae bacterium]|nr:hypothetical protein [Lachnospiraceae bacterium]
MFSEKVQRLKTMLDVAAEQGVLIFQGGEPATPDDIVRMQCVYEDYNYVPEFIVKDAAGEIKEIWYSERIGRKRH